MRKIPLALVVMFVLAIPGESNTAQGDPTQSCTPLKSIYSERNWHDATPLDGHSPCQPQTRRGARHTIEHFRLWRRYRLAAPYAGLNEGDKWLRYLAVPAYVVACETRGYYGQGRWAAAGGGIGPYQFQGWSVPWPVRSAEDKVEHHEQASRLSLSNWACA